MGQEEHQRLIPSAARELDCKIGIMSVSRDWVSGKR